MQICMLVEETMHPIPDAIDTNNNYGPESIVDKRGKHLASGDVYHLTGSEEAIKDWLRPFNCVWQCSSPMIGDWTATHIR